MEGFAQDTLFPMEGLRLPWLRASPFAAFYAAMIERRTGERLGSTQLREAYLAWASERGEPELSFKTIRSEMIELGHRHRHSNGIYFADARILPAPRSASESDTHLEQMRLRDARASALASVDVLSRHLALVQRELAIVRRQLSAAL